MARMRTVKPEFWTDGNMIVLSVWARLFYIGTWNFACDRGHLADDPLGLKLKILPADQVDAPALLGELIDAGRIQRRRLTDGRTYLTILRLTDHQKTDPRWKARCPFCSGEDDGGWTRVESEATEPPRSPLTETPVSLAETPPSLREAASPVAEVPLTSENAQPHQDSPKLPGTLPSRGWDGIGGVLTTRAPSEDHAQILDAEIVSDDSGSDPPNLPAIPTPDNAGTIVAAWIDHCRANGIQLTKRVIGHYAKRIRTALDEGFTPVTVKRALAQMLAEGVAGKPSYLDNHLVSVQNAPRRRPDRRLTPGERTVMKMTNGGQDAEVIDLVAQILRRDPA